MYGSFYGLLLSYLYYDCEYFFVVIDGLERIGIRVIYFVFLLGRWMGFGNLS